MDFAASADHWVKLKEGKKTDKFLDFARELKKNVEHESDGDKTYSWCSWYSHEKTDTRTGGLESKRTSEDHPNYRFI